MKESPWLVWIYPVEVLNVYTSTPRLEITNEMRKMGWRVDLIAPGPAGKHIVQGVEVLCYPWPNVYLVRQMFFHLSIVWYIIRNWALIEIVLFSHNSVPWILPLRFLQKLNKKSPLFVMDTRTVPMQPVEKESFKDKIRGRFHFLMNNLANRFADGQTAITQRMAHLLSIPNDKLWGTWPSGVKVEEFFIASQKRRWPWHTDPVILIYIGSLSYGRNLLTLCRAVVEANRLGMKFNLLLYGEGTEKKDLETFVSQADNSIRLYGTVPHNQVPEILSYAHVGTLPFPDEEKFQVSSPIKLFEYMGAGLPILATKIVCHTDVMGNKDFVFWAENSDLDGILCALQHVWEERATLSILGEKALAAASDWTYMASAKRLNSALQYGLGKLHFERA
jgi:glycosyltransferase involved in cell wall biosynthesis